MRDVIKVSAEHNYEIVFSNNWRNNLLSMVSTRSRCAVICTPTLRNVIGELEAGDCEFLYCVIPDGEEGKNPNTLLQLWNWLAAAGFTRSDLVVGIGGGAVTDIAGFAAATYLRGIDWIGIPTSVAGAVDAAVGGKTGANLDYGKNLIGSFYSPQSVIVDTSWFESLTDRDFSAGLAEVVKCGFIKDPEILNLLSGKSVQDIRSNPELVSELTVRAIQVKATVVSGDFRESFDREILNYGHTFGHAVEKHASYSLRHGECVSIGMAFMAHLQLELGLISREIFDLHFSILKSLNLPVAYSKGEWVELRALMSLDKKARGESLRFVTITGLGETSRLTDVDSSMLLAAYERVRL